MASSIPLYFEAKKYLEICEEELNQNSSLKIGAIELQDNLLHCKSILKEIISIETNSFLISSVKCLKQMIKEIIVQKPKCSSIISQQMDEDRKFLIEKTLVKNEKCIRLGDLAGLTNAKKVLTEAVIMPLKYPHLFIGNCHPWTCVLLYGPPGTGKSQLAQSVASEISGSFFNVSSTDLISSLVGESEKLIRELFKSASDRDSRSVIFIDEIDSICRQRNSKEEDYTRRIKTELLKQMELSKATDVKHGFFLLCATNCPWELDAAFLRRFQKKIYIPLPCMNTRKMIIQIHCNQTNITMTDSDWDYVAEKTEGFSCSDLTNLALNAIMEPVRELQFIKKWCTTLNGMFTPYSSKISNDIIHRQLEDLPTHLILPRKVNVNDFLLSLSSIKKTVTTEDLIKFDYFTKQYGQIG